MCPNAVSCGVYTQSSSVLSPLTDKPSTVPRKALQRMMSEPPRVDEVSAISCVYRFDCMEVATVDQHLIARMAGSHWPSSGKVNNVGVLWCPGAVVAKADVLSIKLSMAATTTAKTNTCCYAFHVKTQNQRNSPVEGEEARTCKSTLL